MKTTTRGWYAFADGYKAWFSGLSGTAKKAEIRKHGPITYFVHTS